MNDLDLYYPHVVGYMLKIMRKKSLSNEKIEFFREEFYSIKHGDYESFLDKFKNISIPLFIIADENSGIRTLSREILAEDNMPNLIKNLAASSALEYFHEECKKIYGDYTDTEISDEIWHKIALFEISLRLHNFDYSKENTLEKVIDKLDISDNHKRILHEGRKFRNCVHGKEIKENDIENFLTAFDLLVSLNLKFIR
jgi:hypothetical protein